MVVALYIGMSTGNRDKIRNTAKSKSSQKHHGLGQSDVRDISLKTTRQAKLDARVAHARKKRLTSLKTARAATPHGYSKDGGRNGVWSHKRRHAPSKFENENFRICRAAGWGGGKLVVRDKFDTTPVGAALQTHDNSQVTLPLAWR